MLGIVDHIIWVRPPWADTLSFDGSVEFEIGIDPSRQHLVGDYPLPYYVLTREDRIFRPRVVGGTTVRLSTIRHDEVSEKLPELLANRGPRDVVVDFDLDYLSTNHPGLTGAAAEAGIPYKKLIDLTKRISFVPRVNRWLKSS